MSPQTSQRAAVDPLPRMDPAVPPGSSQVPAPEEPGTPSSPPPKTVPLHGKKAAGRVALVDDADYELVMQYRWYVEERVLPSRTDGPYARTTVWRDSRRVNIWMHKLITGWPMTDHRNGDGLDNQRRNLRPANCALNNYNQRPYAGKSSRYKGVTWHKYRKNWQAEIKIGGTRRYLGSYASEEEAAAAYVAAALELQGEYAYAARDGLPPNDVGAA